MSWNKKYIDVLNYADLKDLYEILEKDDDVIFKWYTNKDNNNDISKSKVSKLLKNFKID